MDKQLVEKLAKKFSEVLSQWLTEDEMVELLHETKAEKDPSICHSHDYCDANMAMLEAFQSEGLETSDSNMELWGNAWNLAKSELFYQKHVPSLF